MIEFIISPIRNKIALNLNIFSWQKSNLSRTEVVENRISTIDVFQQGGEAAAGII